MEFEITSIRIILFVVMLGIAGIMDAKTRRIPDILWLIFGGIGAILYIWDYDTLTPYHHIAMILGGSVALMVWRWRITGIADSFAIIAMSVILPVHYEFVMMPILILVLTFFTVVFGAVLYNVSLNLVDMIRAKSWIFSEFTTESKFKKIFAFLSIHRKRKYEKFVISAENYSKENNVKSFVFFTTRSKIITTNQIQQSNVKYVKNVPPLIAFLFGVAVFLLLPKILEIIL